MNEKTYRFHFYQNKKIYFGISIVLLVVGILASVIIGPTWTFSLPAAR